MTVEWHDPGAGPGETARWKAMARPNPLGHDPQRVVVVEDDALTVDLLVDVLAEAGYTATVLYSPLDAHREIARLQPRAILLDLELPYGSGAALLRELKADPATAGIPIVVISAYTETLAREDVALLAAMMPKPFPPQALLATLQAAA